MTVNPVAVAIHGFSVNSGLLALINVLLGGAVVAWIKTRPKVQEQDNARRKDEMDALRDRVEELEKQIKLVTEAATKADERAHQAEMKAVREAAIAETKISRAANAVQLVIGELERVSGDKDNPVIRQARELIAAAATGDFGFGGYLGKLATIPTAGGSQ